MVLPDEYTDYMLMILFVNNLGGVFLGDKQIVAYFISHDGLYTTGNTVKKQIYETQTSILFSRITTLRSH